MITDFLFSPTTIAIVAAVLPALLLLWYIYRQDSAQPEPASWLWKGVDYGVRSALIVLLVMLPIPSLEDIAPAFAESVPGAVIDAFFYAAIPEEAAKLLMLWLLLRKNPYFDEHLDGIVYATCVGLGFAGFENILYLINNMDDLAYVATSRALFSVPGHFFFAVVMGYCVSRAYFGNQPAWKRNYYYAMAFIAPMILHGIYDSLLMAAHGDEVWVAFCILAFLVFVHFLRKLAVKKIHQLQQ